MKPFPLKNKQLRTLPFFYLSTFHKMGLVSFLQSVLQLVGLVLGALLTFKTLRANPYIEADGARMLRFWAVLSAFFLYSSYLEWAEIGRAHV